MSFHEVLSSSKWDFHLLVVLFLNLPRIKDLLKDETPLRWLLLYIRTNLNRVPRLTLLSHSFQSLYFRCFYYARCIIMLAFSQSIPCAKKKIANERETWESTQMESSKKINNAMRLRSLVACMTNSSAAWCSTSETLHIRTLQFSCAWQQATMVKMKTTHDSKSHHLHTL